MTVNAAPTISGNAPICIGSTLQLTGSGTPNGSTPWSSANTAVATVDNSGVVTGVSAGSSVITYTNSAGCQATTAVTVNNLFILLGVTTICGTSTITLTGSGAPALTSPWTSSNTGAATVDNSGNVTGAGAGTATITYTNSNGCQASQVVTVNANPTISGVIPVCVSGTIQLTGSGTVNPTTPWTTSNAGVATISNTGLVTAIASGTVTITYFDINGCQNTSSVTVASAPVINPIPDQTICESYALPGITGSNLTPGVSYWSGSGGTGTQMSAGNVISTTSTIYIYDMNGSCSDEESFIITIIQAPTLDVASDLSACASYTLPVITGLDLTGNEAYYSDSQANSGTLISGPITSTQTVWIYDGTGTCADEISFVVIINSVPSAAISGGGTYCQGDAVNNILVDLVGIPDWTVNYTLNGSAQTATGSSTPISLGNTPGTYVLVDLTDSACTATLTGTQTISITSTPNSPTAGTDAEYCLTGTFADITASGNGGTLTWYNNPSLTTSIGSGSTFAPQSTPGVTTYYVTETVSGCEGPASTVQITLIECDIAVPTAFTPNADGAHDTWELINLDNAYPNNIVRIYNRWGNILFESEQGKYNSNVWDGSYKGEILPVGSYYFIIELNNDDKESITGTVTIVLQ